MVALEGCSATCYALCAEEDVYPHLSECDDLWRRSRSWWEYEAFFGASGVQVSQAELCHFRHKCLVAYDLEGLL